MYGSLNNHLQGNGIHPTKPEIGMGATLILWTDRHAGTIIEVSKSGKRIKVQLDKSTRVDKNGMSDSQQYEFERDPEGAIYEVSLRKDGKWKTVGGTTVFGIGYRQEYYDYSF